MSTNSTIYIVKLVDTQNIKKSFDKVKFNRYMKWGHLKQHRSLNNHSADRVETLGREYTGHTLSSRQTVLSKTAHESFVDIYELSIKQYLR